MPCTFAVEGIVVLFNAYSYAKLGVRYPTAGGPVEFLIRGFGNSVLSGGLNILLWVGCVFALALYGRAFGGYAMTFMPKGSIPAWVGIFGIATVLFFVVNEFTGSKAVAAFEFLCTF